MGANWPRGDHRAEPNLLLLATLAGLNFPTARPLSCPPAPARAKGTDGHIINPLVLGHCGEKPNCEHSLALARDSGARSIRLGTCWRHGRSRRASASAERRALSIGIHNTSLVESLTPTLVLQLELESRSSSVRGLLKGGADIACLVQSLTLGLVLQLKLLHLFLTFGGLQERRSRVRKRNVDSEEGRCGLHCSCVLCFACKAISAK